MIGLISFPEPYPDEDFRSVLYRYHIRTANIPFYESNNELFGKNSIKNLLFPTHLNELFRRLPEDHLFDLENILYNHTWYGLIRAFISKEKHLEFMETFKYGTDNHFWMTNKYKGIFSSTIKYCPICIVEDTKKYGECFVHRIHQLEFLDFCPQHFIKLIDHCLKCGTILSKPYGSELVRSSFCPQGHYLCDQVYKVENQNPITQFKFQLFKVVCSIRDFNGMLSSQKIYQKILMGLWKKGFIHFKGRIYKEELVSSIIDLYSIDAIEAINLPLTYITNKSFFNRILKEDFKGDILFYCLLILFLFKSIKSMIDINEPIANPLPFGFGPWQCLNRICNHYNKSVIAKCKRIAKISGGMYITGEFACPYCGYTYTKRWHPTKDMKEKVMIKFMGDLWINRVLKMFTQGHSANEIAIALNCSEFAVRSNLTKIVGKAKKLESHEERDAVKEIIQGYLETASYREVSMVKTSIYRKQIEVILRKENIYSRLELFNAAPKEYTWLKMYDGKWLDSVIPIPNNKRKIPTDYSGFDKELALKIESLAKELYDNYPYKICKSTIIKRLKPLEASRIKSLSDKVPISVKTINRYIESTNEYLIRSLPRVINKLRKKGYKNIKFETLISYAPSYRKCDSDTKNRIKLLLKEGTFSV